MEYVLLIHADEAKWADATEDDRKGMYAAHQEFATALAEAKVQMKGGAELAGSATGAVVRGYADATVTDGPFTEAREQLGGFYVIDVPTRQDAIAWAKRLPADIVEVRATVQQ
jgi:hypothetical protein